MRDDDAEDRDGGGKKASPGPGYERDASGGPPPPDELLLVSPWTTTAGLTDPDDEEPIINGTDFEGSDILRDADETATSRSSGEGVRAEE